MKLRRLRMDDAALMVEWMHDASVVKNLERDFSKQTIEDCEEFILAASDMESSIHLAIVDERDIYMGTVSLKNISGACAEFAITVRKSAMGKGYAGYGMHKIMQIGFEELGIKYIYWCVNPKNSRAVAFYSKQGYRQVDVKELAAKTHKNDCSFTEQYFWYLEEKKATA